jgi:hypothetical protein
MWFELIFFTGSLAVWNVRGGAAISRPLCPRRAERGEGEKSFELYSIYTASQDFASVWSPRASLALGARLLIYIHFWLKIEKFYQLRTKENFPSINYEIYYLG